MSSRWLIVALISVLVPSTLNAQPRVSWTRTFGGEHEDEGLGFQKTADSGYVITGYTSSFGAGSQDLWIVKTNRDGDLVWSRPFGGWQDDCGMSVKEIAGGGFIVAGGTSSFGSGSSDLWLVKASANGDSVWARTFGGRGEEGGYSVQQTDDGGFVIGGVTSSFGAGGYDAWLVRTDENGDSLWSRTFGGSENDIAQGVLQTPDGGFLIGGTTFSFGAGAGDFWLVRTNAQGDSLWSRTFGGANTERAWDVEQVSDGGFVIAGQTRSFGVGQDDIWIVRTDLNGDTLWARTFGGAGNEDGWSARETSDGGFIIGATSTPVGGGAPTVWLLKTDADGDSLWARTIEGGDYLWWFKALPTEDAGFAIVGATRSWAGNGDVWLIKTEAVEEVTPGREVGNLPSVFAILDSYPNPFNQSTRINYSLPIGGVADLKVFDIMGRLATTLNFGYQRSGNHTFVWRANDLPSGMYIIQLDAGKMQAQQRVTLLK